MFFNVFLCESEYCSVNDCLLFSTQKPQIHFFQVFPGVSRRCSHLCILQRPQVQQVKVARHRRAEWQEGAELWQLAVAWGNHGDWRVAEGERGQVGEQ